jgi:hypothetical protein
MLSVQELQAEDREFTLCQNLARNLLHELPRVIDGETAQEIQGSSTGEAEGERCLSHDHRQVAASIATECCAP